MEPLWGSGRLSRVMRWGRYRRGTQVQGPVTLHVAAEHGQVEAELGSLAARPPSPPAISGLVMSACFWPCSRRRKISPKSCI